MAVAPLRLIFPPRLSAQFRVKFLQIVKERGSMNYSRLLCFYGLCFLLLGEMSLLIFDKIVNKVNSKSFHRGEILVHKLEHFLYFPYK